MAHHSCNLAPEGFRYVPDVLSAAEERDVIAEIRALAFSEVRMHGVIAKRRVAHFGWVYGYENWRITTGPPIPDFLLSVRCRAAEQVNEEPGEFVEALVTEYPPGAGIGWHRDAPMFGPHIVGLSLLGACRFRFQRGRGSTRETFGLTLEPRSAYVLSGPARFQWQHSIPTSLFHYVSNGRRGREPRGYGEWAVWS